MTYDAWLEAIDNALRANKIKTRVRDIEPAALEEAFDLGKSPVVFVRDGIFPARQPSTPVQSYKRGNRFLPLLICLLALVTGSWVVVSVIRDRDAARFANSKIRYPIVYPVRLSTGAYTPVAAVRAREFSLEEVQRSALVPESVDFRDLSGITESAKDVYETTGKVRAKNEFGTEVEAEFGIRVKRNLQGDGFVVLNMSLGRSGGSLVWRAPKAGSSEPSYEPFRQKRTVPGLPTSVQRGGNLYSGD